MENSLPAAFIFGREEVDFSLTPELVKELVLEGRERSMALSRVPVRRIAEVLGKAGKCWEKGSPVYVEALKKLEKILPFSREVIEYSLAMIPNLLSPANILVRLCSEFSLNSADDFHRFRGADSYTGSTLFLPLGTLLNVAAGNVFLGALDSLVSALITGNSAIVKLSSADPLFMMLFARTLAAVDSEKLVSDAYALVPFSGGDKLIEDAFKSLVDAVVVWGGKDTINAYRTNVSSGCRIIEHGPKLSFAVCLREVVQDLSVLEETAGQIARDIALWDQSACSSPQFLYVEGTFEDALSVAEKLAQALEKLSRIWPSGFASPDEQIELTKMREIASYNAAQGEGFLLMPKDRSLSYTIAYSKDKSPESSPLNRSVYIKTVDSADEICSLIRPVSGYLQSVAIGGPLNRTTLIGEKLLKSGVCRVVPPGKMLEEKSGAPHDGRYNLCDLVKLVALEDRRDPFSQVAELFDFLSIKSSFWAERLEKFNPEEASSLSLVPYTKASEIVDNVPPLGNSLLTGPVSGSMVFASGGSTGKPKYIFYSYPEFDAVSKALAKCLMAAGLRKDDIAANGFVAGSLWTSFLAVHNALAYSGCFSLPIGGTSSVRQTVGYIVDFKATVVLGIPSYLTELARIIESDGLKDKLNVRLLLYAGERVTDSTAKYLCEAFGCKLIRSAGYASVDAGTIGYQCSYCEGSNHHILRDYQYVEFISPDTGEPVTEGECGEIVVTNLNRRLMPVVRMRSGDLGALSGIECPCGSPDPLFNLLGRADDRVFAGGARFMAGDFAKLAGTFEGLSSRVQIKLSSFNGLDHVAFLVESESPIPEEDKVLLSEKVIRAFIEAEEDYRFAFENDWIGKPSCTIVETGQIPRVERTGKIRLVADSRHGDGR